MGFRFRKSINLGGGFKINLSKSGVGYSWGTKGVRFTKTSKGSTRTTLGIPGSGLTYTTETNNKKHSTRQASPTVETNNTKGGPQMVWVDFLICLFFGILGIHKFRERKIGIGILYLFTGGLLGIGWLCDCFKYLMFALQTQQLSTTATGTGDTDTTPELPNSTSKIMVILKKYSAWFLVALFALLALVFMPSFSSFLALLAIAFIIPIAKWQKIVGQYVHGTIKKIAVIALALFTLISAPTTEQANNNHPEPSITISTEPVHIHEFSNATCTEAKVCDCGATEGDPLGHSWVDATCQTAMTCSVCNIEEGTIAEHTWVDATCLIPKTCSVCNTTIGETVGHAWMDATCLAPQTCFTCKATDGEVSDHTWLDATCSKPMTCSVCNITEGDLAEHTWQEATCQVVKTCSVCGETNGDLADHTWQAATCLAPKTCSVCGETEGFRADHVYKNGACTVCETEEPTVWIPRSGSKYHSYSGCSNMKNPSEVPISKAKAMGYEPCSKC